MLYGLLDLSVKGYVIAVLILAQITIACVTLYLHRCQTHQALTLHPVMSHFFRFWLWLTTGIRTKEWVAIHRKHHARCETSEDPHSPKVLGLKKILLEGAEVYRLAKTKETVMRYGHGTPDDWIERNVYTQHDKMGIASMLIINLLLFGIPGLSIWAIQMIWIPLFAGGVVNGIGHYYGYRNFEPKDASTNIFPLAIFVGGEELHNNHHTFPSSAKLSAKWWEFDLGWLYIRILQFFRLAKVKRSIPELCKKSEKSQIDLETLKVVVSHRLQIMADYAREVILPVLTKERRNLNKKQSALFLGAEKLLTKSDCLLDEKMRNRILLMLCANPAIARIYQFKVALQKIWEQTTASQFELLEALKKWHKEATADDNMFLRNFAIHLPRYSA